MKGMNYKAKVKSFFNRKYLTCSTFTVSEIANSLKCSEGTVNRHLRPIMLEHAEKPIGYRAWVNHSEKHRVVYALSNDPSYMGAKGWQVMNLEALSRSARESALTLKRRRMKDGKEEATGPTVFEMGDGGVVSICDYEKPKTSAKDVTMNARKLMPGYEWIFDICEKRLQTALEDLWFDIHKQITANGLASVTTDALLKELKKRVIDNTEKKHA